jgi:formylmethanofuran dehydrogenase subunit E
MGNTSSHGDDKELQECIGFHGHFCPGLAIGFRSARELMRILGASKAGDEELFAIVETDACGADAIQVMTGCTFGKGNFSFLDHGKHAFILGSRRRSIAFRASLRADAEIFDDKLAGCLKRMQSNTATPEERNSFFRLRDDAGRRILDMELEKLLKIEEAKIEFPPKARIVRSEVCPVCKEPVRHDYMDHLHGAPACRSCRESSNT